VLRCLTIEVTEDSEEGSHFMLNTFFQGKPTLLGFLAWAAIGIAANARPVAVATAHDSPIINYGLGKLKRALAAHGDDVLRQSLTAETGADIVVLLQSDEQMQQLYPTANKLAAEGYQLAHKNGKLLVIGADEKGATYGILDVAEQLTHSGDNLGQVREKTRRTPAKFPGYKVQPALYGLSFQRITYATGPRRARPSILGEFSGYDGRQSFQCAVVMEHAPISLHG